MKSGVIFGVVLVIILAAIVISHQMSDGGNDHFDKGAKTGSKTDEGASCPSILTLETQCDPGPSLHTLKGTDDVQNFSI